MAKTTNLQVQQTASNPTTLSILKLRNAFTGRVIAPGDPQYDKARTIFYGGIDRRPAVIIQVADSKDVSRVISLSRDTGLPLAIRSGGHSVSGHSMVDGGIVLDLSTMRALQMDIEAHTALEAGGNRRRSAYA